MTNTVVGQAVASTTTDYRCAAIALWASAGAYVHDAYTRLLPLFPELPPQLPIVIGITAYGHCSGLTRCDWQHGPRITIASNEFRQCRKVDDVMAHEMLHAALALAGKDTAHNSDDWYSAITRLSPAVLHRTIEVRRGADRKSVRVKRDDGSSVVRKVANPDAVPHRLVAGWPMSFRPHGYDYGPSIDCPTY